MATQTIRIIVEERGSKQAAQGLRGIAREATAGDKALGLLKTALAAVGVGVAIKQYVELSNTYQTLQNRIRLVTSSQQEQTAVTRELLDVSNQTFTSLRDTTELYARLAFNTRNLGLTQQEVLDVTRSLNQAVILSGAGAREASNAIIQLSQGLASGTLRGDELRSVLEQLPFVTDVIAESLEVDRSALRRLGAEGEITSEKIIRALQEAAPRIQAEFEKLTPTIGQAFQVLQNQILAAVGEFNNATGASNFFAKAILSIADGMTDVADIAIAFFEEFNSYADAADDLLKEAFGVSLKDAQFTFRNFLRFIGSFIDTVTGLFIGLGQGIVTFWTSVFNNLKGIGERTINGAATVIEAVVNAIIKGINSAIQGVARSLNGLLEVANDAAEFLGQGPIFDPIRFNNLVELNLGRVKETPFIDVGKAVGAAFKKGFNSPQGARNFIDDVLRRADARALRRAREGRNLGDPVRNPNADRAFKTANDILIQQLREQLAVERELIETRGQGTTLQLAQAEAIEKFNKQVERDKILLNPTQREELEGIVRANAERKVRNELDKQIRDFNQDLEDELTLLNLSTAEREVEADLLRIINAHKKAGIALDPQELANMRAKRAELQRRVTQEQILNQVFGDREAVLKRIADLQRLRSQEQDFGRARSLRVAEIDAGRESRQGDLSFEAGFLNGLGEIEKKVLDVAGGVEQALTNAFNSAEDALVEFVQTGKFNFSGFVDSILADITRLLARQAILALFNAFSGGAGGGAGLFSAFALSGARAEGGPVSQGRSYLVGERGPEIFQPNQSGTIIPNGAVPSAAPQTNITVVNVMDPAMVSTALNDPQNQQVIVNIIGKHKQAVNRQLGNG